MKKKKQNKPLYIRTKWNTIEEVIEVLRSESFNQIIYRVKGKRNEIFEDFVIGEPSDNILMLADSYILVDKDTRLTSNPIDRLSTTCPPHVHGLLKSTAANFIQPSMESFREKKKDEYNQEVLLGIWSSDWHLKPIARMTDGGEWELIR